jgi:hypothetical protein
MRMEWYMEVMWVVDGSSPRFLSGWLLGGELVRAERQVNDCLASPGLF